MKGFKGFNKDLVCRDFQYEIGKTFETDRKPVRCTENGFHFCEYPLDVFNYYPPSGNRFCEVEADGQIDKDGDDSKVATSKISIGLEVGLKGLVEGAVKFIFERVDWSSKKESNTGDQSAATNTGSQSAATNTGYQSAAIVEGKESIACALGIESRAKGALGCWIVVAEWYRDNCYDWHIKDVKTALVDGITIKADTFYILKDGTLVEFVDTED